jgi:biotin synthase-related radical SAM superfamily protein
MSDEHSEILGRIAALRAEAEHGGRGPEMVETIEVALSDGYAHALAGEAQLMRLENDLQRVMDAAEPGRAEEVGRIVREHRSIERSVARLREALAAMHDDFVMLGGARPR